jgi:hypothetical protein
MPSSRGLPEAGCVNFYVSFFKSSFNIRESIKTIEKRDIEIKKLIHTFPLLRRYLPQGRN